jgi:thioredoxin 1
LAINRDYTDDEPTRDAVDALPGATLVEFGSVWCGYCRRVQPLLAAAFEGHDAVRHIKVADASGRPLGRSFGVRLWPTLVFMKDGHELTRLVRPQDAEPIRRALAMIDDRATAAT